jgi:hypothetical protein
VGVALGRLRYSGHGSGTVHGVDDSTLAPFGHAALSGRIIGYLSYSRSAQQASRRASERKKPGRPDIEDAANLEVKTGPVNTMACKARRRIENRRCFLGSLKGPKSLFTPHGRPRESTPLRRMHFTH